MDFAEESRSFISPPWTAADTHPDSVFSGSPDRHCGLCPLRFGMDVDVGFNLFPVALVVSDFFAEGAERQDAQQGLDFVQGVGQLAVGGKQLFGACGHLVFEILPLQVQFVARPVASFKALLRDRDRTERRRMTSPASQDYYPPGVSY